MEALKPEKALTRTQSEVLTCLRSYRGGLGRTWLIARDTRHSTWVVRRALQALVQRGLVERHERYSAVNDIMWALLPATRLSQGA